MKFLWVFDYDAYMTLPIIIGLLWALGGSGVKHLRRFGVPVILSLSALSLGMPILQCAFLFLTTLLVYAFGPGYGDSLYKKLKGGYWFAVVGLGFLYGFCQFPITVVYGGWWAFIGTCCLVSGIFTGSMYLSKNLGLPWKLAEIMTGVGIGLVFCFAGE